MKIIYAAISDAGLREGENQDSILCQSDENGGVFLVADGMGGHENGKEASSTVREEVSLAWERCFGADGKEIHTRLQDETLTEALKKANKRIRKQSGQDIVSGSTAVLVRISKENYSVFNCGDSRCYYVKKILTGRRGVLLTADDVWENQPENVRGLSAKQRRSHTNFGKLVRAVGTETEFSCSGVHGKMPDRALFALCSDGVWKCLDEGRFLFILKETFRNAGSAQDLMKRIDRIRDTVYENGAPDNFSLIFVLTERGK